MLTALKHASRSFNDALVALMLAFIYIALFGLARIATFFSRAQSGWQQKERESDAHSPY